VVIVTDAFPRVLSQAKAAIAEKPLDLLRCW
jgi:hypothetical protein